MQLRRARFLVVLICLSLAAGIARAEPKRVLVVHSVEAEADWIVPSFMNLLGHFDCQITTLPAAQYQSGQLASYAAAYYLGAREEKLPRALLADLYDAEIPVCWVGANLDQLAGQFSLGRYGFRLGRAPVAMKEVSYQGRRFPTASPYLPEVTVTRPEACTAIAMAGETPYAVRSGRFWYFPEMALDGLGELSSWLVLADQLHEMLAEEHPPRRTAFLCLSEINPLTEARAVRRMTDILEKERVPFALAITSVLRDPAREREVRLLDRGDLVAVLRRAQDKGAALIALGLTHQCAGRTGSEAEFWDEARNAPLLERSSEDTHRRLDLAITELSACGLYPVAWTTPRGLASPADYAEMAQNFSTAWERRLPGIQAPAPQLFPFLIQRDSNGQRLLPDSGLRLGRKEGSAACLEAARQLEAVRDPWVSFAISPEASEAEVKRLVSTLQQAGWEFADLRKMDNWVKSTPLQIFTRAQEARLGEVIPVGWNATLFLPGEGRDRRYEHAAARGQAQGATVPPGAVVVTYPPGVELDVMFLPGGRGRQLTHALAQRVMLAVTRFAIGACVVFLALYLLQVTLQRRRT